MNMVVAGIIGRDGRLLICQRKADQPHGLKWEFPGGKMELGESPEEALVRELNEELGIEATIGQELLRYEFEYPGKKPILLIFLEVAGFKGEPENRIFQATEWCEPNRLQYLDFLEGDARFNQWLTGWQSA